MLNTALKSLFCLLVLSLPAHAYFVLWFDVKDQKLAPHLPADFSVIAVLPDYFAHPLWAPDALEELLIENHHPNPRVFVERYLNALYPWYLRQLTLHPRVYGKDIADQVSDLPQQEPVFDGQSAVLVFTQFQDPSRPIAIQRRASPGADGLLPFQSHHGAAAGPVTNTALAPQWISVPTLQSRFRRDHFPLGLPLPEVTVEKSADAAGELKMYFLQQGDLGVFTYSVARALGFYTRAPGGHVLSRLFLQAYSPILERYYLPSGFERLRYIQQAGKPGKKKRPPISLMQVEVAHMHSIITQRIEKRYPGFTQAKPAWLVYNHAFSQRLLKIADDCVENLLPVLPMPTQP